MHFKIIKNQSYLMNLVGKNLFPNKRLSVFCVRFRVLRISLCTHISKKRRVVLMFEQIPWTQHSAQLKRLLHYSLLFLRNKNLHVFPVKTSEE